MNSGTPVPSTAATSLSEGSDGQQRSSSGGRSASPSPHIHNPTTPLRTPTKTFSAIASGHNRKSPSPSRSLEGESGSKGSSSSAPKNSSSSSLKRKHPSSYNECSNSDSETTNTFNTNTTTTPTANYSKASGPSSGKRSNTASPNPYTGSSSTGPSSPQTQNTSAPLSIATVPKSERQQLALLMKQFGSSSPSAHNSNCEQDAVYHSGSTSSCSPGAQASSSQSQSQSSTPGRKGGLYKRNQMGETPLHLAAKKGDLEKVKRLIKLGADVNAKDYAGWTALHEACFKDHVQVAACLLHSGADVNAQGGEDEDTPLHDTAARHFYDASLLLLKHGGDPNRLNKLGESAVSLAKDDSALRDLFAMESSEWNTLPFRETPQLDVNSFKDVATPMSTETTMVVTTGTVGDDRKRAAAVLGESKAKDKKTVEVSISVNNAEGGEMISASKPEDSCLAKSCPDSASDETLSSVPKTSTSAAVPSAMKHPSSSSGFRDSTLSESFTEPYTSEDEFADSPGELFIDEGADENPKKNSASSSSSLAVSSANSKTSQSSTFVQSHSSQSSSSEKSSSLKPPFQPISKLVAPESKQSEPKPSTGSATQIGLSVKVPGDLTQKPETAVNADISSSLPDQSSKTSTGQSVEGDSSSAKVSPPFPNIITAEGELLKKKKKKDKHKEKKEKESTCSREASDLVSSGSDKHGSRDKMTKKKRKHESRSNSEDSITSSQGSKRTVDMSSDSLSDRTASNSSLDKVEAPKVPSSSTVAVRKQSNPMKPLKVETKVKLSLGKLKDDDKLFKPDPVVKSPKLSPKSHEKATVKRQQPTTHSSGSGVHSETHAAISTGQTWKPKVDRQVERKKEKHHTDQKLAVTDSKLKEKEHVETVSDCSSAEANAEHQKTLVVKSLNSPVNSASSVSPSAKSPHSTTVTSSATAALTVTCSEALSTSAPPSSDIFKTSPVVRLTVEPKIEAKSSQQFTNAGTSNAVASEKKARSKQSSPALSPIITQKDDAGKVSTNEDSKEKESATRDEKLRKKDEDKKDAEKTQKVLPVVDAPAKLPKIMIGDKLMSKVSPPLDSAGESDSIEDSPEKSNQVDDSSTTERVSASECNSATTGDQLDQVSSRDAESTGMTVAKESEEKAGNGEVNCAQNLSEQPKVEVNFKIERGSFGVATEKIFAVLKPTGETAICSSGSASISKSGESQTEVVDKITCNQESEIDVEMRVDDAAVSVEPVSQKAKEELEKEAGDGIQKLQQVKPEMKEEKSSQQLIVSGNSMPTENSSKTLLVTAREESQVKIEAGMDVEMEQPEKDQEQTKLSPNEHSVDNRSEAQKLDDSMASLSAQEDASSGRGIAPRRRKKPLKFSDGAENSGEFVASANAPERGRPPKRSMGSQRNENASASDKQTRRKARLHYDSSDTKREENEMAATKTRTGTRNSTKASLALKSEKTGRLERGQSPFMGGSTPDQPPIILKISASQLRTASPTRSQMSYSGDPTESENSNSILTERSCTPVRSESIVNEDSMSDVSRLPKSERTPRVTRTLRSNAHLKRDLGASGDSMFLHNEDSNSSSCSNDSGTRKQGVASLRSSGSLVETKEDSPSNVCSRSQTPTLSQQSSNETTENVVNKVEIGSMVDEQNGQGGNSDSKTTSESSGGRSEVDESNKDSKDATSQSGGANGTLASHSSSSQVSNAASEPPQHPKRRKLAKHKAEQEAKANSILEVPPIAPPDDKFTNPIYTYLQMKRSMRQKQICNLPVVTPKVQPFYDDYYCIKKQYLIEGHKNNYPKLRAASHKLDQFQELKQLFEKQEKERNKLRVQQLVERERLQLVCECETLRIYTRSALAEKSQSANLSVCQILAEDDFYNVSTDFSASNTSASSDLPRACSSRSRHNLRQFQSWISDNNEKLDKLKNQMLKRHDHETHALRASQALEWSYKLRHPSLTPAVPLQLMTEFSEAHFVPRVELAQDVSVVPF